MKKEEDINYREYKLDPKKDVLVPYHVYNAYLSLSEEVLKKHSKIYREDKHSWYNKETHKKLSPKKASRMDDEKLNENYYQNIDLERTEKTGSIYRDELGTVAMRLHIRKNEVLQRNVDKGNAMKIEQENNQEDDS